MSQLRKSFVHTRRDAWVEVNLGAVEHNIKELKSLILPRTKIMAVVKADAYGHGAAMLAPTLVASGVSMLGVASVDEGIQLREAGITAPVLVLGAAPNWAFEAAVENDISLSIFTQDHIQSCINTYNKLKIRPVTHIKVDTGMHRIGIPYYDAKTFINKVANTPEIKLEGVFTHLACAEISDITAFQRAKWLDVINQIDYSGLALHTANTAGMIAYSELHFDMVRSGIGIYGLMPDLADKVSAIPCLKQVMSLKGRIIHLQELESNSGISYGYSYKTDSALTRVATIPIGYADGVSRSLSNNIYGLLKGKKVRQIGNITMDQMMFDVSEIENTAVGDVITLLGEDGKDFISIDSWADKLKTINYEITCRLKVRLPRVYTRD